MTGPYKGLGILRHVERPTHMIIDTKMKIYMKRNPFSLRIQPRCQGLS